MCVCVCVCVRACVSVCVCVFTRNTCVQCDFSLQNFVLHGPGLARSDPRRDDPQLPGRARRCCVFWRYCAGQLSQQLPNKHGAVTGATLREDSGNVFSIAQ